MSSTVQINFPRKPYDGQLKLAQSIYSACENGSTAIFESPTGTGKSLAVLSGALSYLNKNAFDRQKVLSLIQKLKKEYGDVSNDKTIKNEEKFKKMHVLRCELDELDEKLHVQSQIEKYLTESPEDTLQKERKRYASNEDENAVVDEELDDIVKLGKNVKKVIYVSRTHSQLTQFIREMDNPLHKSTRPVQIGSRASVCINPNVNSLPPALVNCECARLVKNSCGDIEDIEMDSVEASGSKGSKKETCPFYKRSKILKLRSSIWKGSLIKSSTTLKEEGEKLGACPFFAAKAALPLCDVVAMPYNVLFDKISRDSYGVNIEDNIVIVDEAHNFLSTVHETASFTLNVPDLKLAKNSLEFYLKKTWSTKTEKLSAVRQIISTLSQFTDFLQTKATNNEVQILKPVDIRRDLWKTTAEDYLKLATLIDSGDLIRESRGILSRYWTSMQNVKSSEESVTTPANKLSALAKLVRQSQKEAMPEVLRGKKRTATPMPQKPTKVMKMSTSESPVPMERLQVDGVQLFGSFIKLFRALLQSDFATFVYNSKEQKLRYIRLDIDSDLQKVIESSKSFIMIGGSMRPKGYISSVLRSSCSIKDVVEQQFGHVIPTRNVLPLVISTDAQNNILSLKVSQLNDTILVRYAKTLNELFNHIPYGCVVFLPNYNLIIAFEKLLSTLKPRKQMFSEKRGQDVDDLMRKFSQSAKNSRSGAVLLASASGRLGEGINFADNMCRGVIIVGLPYPNAMDIETKLRATHAVEQGYCTSVHEYLSQACTRVVSQCMGRAIRHANDFSALIFMDSRYQQSSGNNFVASLPEWMTKSLKTAHFLEFSTIFSQFYSPLMTEFDSRKKLK